MRCNACGSNQITEIGFAANDGAAYRYCRVCENGTWESQAGKLATTQVLQAVSRIEPGRRRAAA